jgi:superfamily II DNA/RNA helicase
VNFDKFDLQIENGRAPTSQLFSWDQLLAHARTEADGDLNEEIDFLRQAIDWYEWPSPTKFQAVAIPCIIEACLAAPDAKSYTLLQAAAGLGKTSALALGLLSTGRRAVQNLQSIILATASCEDLERYFNSLGCLCPLKVVYFKEKVADNLESDVAACKDAQIIVGHPARVSSVLKAAQGQDQLCLNDVGVLLIDDAAEVIADGLVDKVCEINQLLSLFVRNPLRYVIVSNFVERQAKPALRALKSSLMSKKNMFDLSHQVGRIRKFVKHYSMEADPKDWFRVLVSLREMIYIPRAVIFCDNEGRFQSLKKSFMTEHIRDQDGKIMSLAVNDNQSQSQSQRHEQFKAFCKEQYDFLLTRSEPNIFQTSLPRVFWIIHFGVESSNLPWYGCRLLCLDSQLRQKPCKGAHHDGVSILFMPPKEKEIAPKLEKMFGIAFEELPFGNLV